MKPLTIEELKALEVGDWVWFIDKNTGVKSYRLKAESSYVDALEFALSGRFGTIVYAISNYGKTWLAYKNKEQAEAKEGSRIISDKEFWELSNRYTQKELDERIEFAKKKAVEELKAKGEIVELPCLFSVEVENFGELVFQQELVYRAKDGSIRTTFYNDDEYEKAQRRIAELKGERV